MRSRYPLAFIVICFSTALFSQQHISLDECYRAAAAHSPLSAMGSLAQSQADLAIANIRTNWYPQTEVNAQATYQSEVSRLPITLPLPGFEVPSPSKDQYKVTLDARQTIYDGGQIKLQSAVQSASANAQIQQAETEIFKLREKVNQFFFGILSIDANLAILTDIMSDIDTRIERAEVAFRNGALLESAVNQLKAEKLKLRQRKTELTASRSGFVRGLVILTGKELPDNITFDLPVTETVVADKIARPELALFNAQEAQIDAQEKLIDSKNLPKVALFGQAGYGRPGLNFLSNDFDFFGIGGLRVTWALSGFYTARREKEILNLQHEVVNVQRNNFVMGTTVAIAQAEAEIRKLTEMIELDNEIVSLRKSNSIIAASQLENGAITTAEYITELSQEEQARENQRLHQIQLVQARVNLKFLSGY